MADPLRGEVWTLDLNPVRGREQQGRRPGLVVSTNAFNTGPAELVIVVPLTTVFKGIPLHVQIQPPAGGLRKISYVKCEDVRSVSKQRFHKRLGRVPISVLAEVEDRLRILLEL
jgi:mRNA interferase MazF